MIDIIFIFISPFSEILYFVDEDIANCIDLQWLFPLKEEMDPVHATKMPLQYILFL